MTTDPPPTPFGRPVCPRCSAIVVNLAVHDASHARDAAVLRNTLADMIDKRAAEVAYMGGRGLWHRGLTEAALIVRGAPINAAAPQPTPDPEYRQRVLDAIAAATPVNWELNYDGTEDPVRGAYVEGLRDAYDITEHVHTGGEHAQTNTPIQPTAAPNS